MNPRAHLAFLLRQLGYDLDEGLLARPAAFIAAHAALAVTVSVIEPRLGPEWAPFRAALFPLEVSTAQAVLGTLAGSMMTVISVVYSILLVALSLASIQYSPRILAGFVRDRVSRTTLGLFVGTFVYCLLMLRTVRGEPAPYVPSIGIAIALVLALTSLGALVYVIHHIVRSIQANHIVDRIAGDAEAVLDAEQPERLAPGEEPAPPVRAEEPPGAADVPAARSGYVQLVDVDGLSALLRPGLTIAVARPPGGFVGEGTVVAWIAPASQATPALVAAVRAAIDVGAARTMQQDVEFGVRQIVDIGLKAISPAVNDPSTCCTCIDHLGRLLVRAAPRRTPRGRVEAGGGVLLVPSTGFVDLLDLAFEQLRQYGKGDLAVMLRMLRTLGEVARVTPHEVGRRALARHVALVMDAARKGQAAEDLDELDRRHRAVQEALGA